MNDKLNELTKKLYTEGIEKAEKDAQEIIEKSKKQAESIINQAKKQAETILEEAKRQSSDLKKNTESELRMSSKQAVNALKQSITSLVLTSSAKEPVSEVFKDKDFLKSMILKIADNFSRNGFETSQMEVILSDNDRASVESFFISKQKELLDKGLSIQFSDSVESGFQLGPADNTYKISFTEDTFESFFKKYLRDRSIKLLYGEE